MYWRENVDIYLQKQCVCVRVCVANSWGFLLLQFKLIKTLGKKRIDPGGEVNTYLLLCLVLVPMIDGQ